MSGQHGLGIRMGATSLLICQINCSTSIEFAPALLHVGLPLLSTSRQQGTCTSESHRVPATSATFSGQLDGPFSFDVCCTPSNSPVAVRMTSDSGAMGLPSGGSSGVLLISCSQIQLSDADFDQG
jgi:hypothetical protein